MNIKGTYFPAITAALLFLSAYCLQVRFQSHLSAEYAAEKISDYIEEQTKALGGLMSSDGSLLNVNEHGDDDLTSKYPPFFIFDNDQLSYWSNTEIQEPGQLRKAGETGVYVEKDNTYITGELKGTDGLSLIYAIPLRNSDGGSPFGHIGQSLPDEIDLNYGQGVPIYRNGRGKWVLYAQTHDNAQMSRFDLQWLVLLYGLAFVSLSVFLTQQLPNLKTRWGDTMSLGLFVASALAIRVAILTATSYAPLYGLPIFDESLISPALGVSLADLIVNSVLILWMTIVLINHIEPEIPLSKLNWQRKIGWSAMGYLLILASLAGLAWFCTRLILDSQIDFNFESVLDLNTISIVAIFCIIMIVFSIFLWSIKIASWVHAIGFTSRKKIAVGTCVLLLSLPLVHQLIPSVPILQFCLVVLTFVLLLDLFTEARRTNFTWIVVWLVVLSGFSSVLLYKINIDKDTARRQLIAQKLIDQDDHVAMQQIIEFSDHYNRSTPNPPDSSVVDLISATFNHYQGYLSTYYQINFPPTSVIKESHPIDGFEKNIWRNHGSLEQYSTWLEKDGLRILASFKKRKNPRPSAMHIGSTINYKAIEGLEQYEYAIYDSEGVCVERSSPDYPLKMLTSSSPKDAKVTFNDQRSELIYSNGEYTVSVGRKLYGVIKPLSLFSYLFIIVVVAMLCMLLLNCLVTYLPQNFYFSFKSGISLRNRIQISVLSLILLSFVIIGIATVLYFQNAEHKNNLDRIKRTASSLQEEIQFHYHDQQSLISQHSLEHLAIKYQTHINLFGPDGQLIRTSQQAKKVNSSPHVPSRIKYSAMSTLQSLSRSMIPPAKKEGNQEPAYIALNRNGALIGFASLPLQNSLTHAGERVKEFMSTLLNVYVLLLLVAIFLALAVSRSITRPITELVNRIKGFRLGTSHEPLAWHSNDELGILINEYNQMVFKLDESAELLAQTEREVAWREMAKQVAHEIKNPLTPMKLSIQHLQYAMGKADLIESRQLVKRVAITLIEQIDNLSKIAEEFSRFAKMPKPETQVIVLNDLVASVHDLFKKRDDMEFNLYVPIDELAVMADKSHLLRVLNNLIKNAVQAIPASRRGVIDIRLERHENHALLQVTDNGKGICDEMKEKVFYPNFTTKTSGTGLGLAISKNIIESFDGQIYFETEENVGTTFYFKVPLAEESDLRKSGETSRYPRRRSPYLDRAAAIVDPISAGD